jgi:hypothetical protein
MGIIQLITLPSSFRNDFFEFLPICHPFRIVARHFIHFRLDFVRSLQIFQADRQFHKQTSASNAMNQHFVGQTLANHTLDQRP